jgi:uncharacterized protein YjbI with pentapeptide repeats
MNHRHIWIASALLLTVALHCSASRADIYRWDNGQPIPDTEGITPGPGVQLNNRDFEFAELSQTNLADANFNFANLSNARLSGANLTGATFFVSRLTNAEFAGANVAGAGLYGATEFGFTKEQLYSTASYQAKDLRGIRLSAVPVGYSLDSDLSGWDFSAQDLTGASFVYANLSGADLSGATLINGRFSGVQNLTYFEANLRNADLTAADARGAVGLNLAGAAIRNAILPDGRIAGLNLTPGDRLVVRDDDGVPAPSTAHRSPMPVTIQDRLTMADSSTLKFLFDADPWDSLISFEPGIPAQLGGTLELSFAEDVDPASQLGRTLQIFDWTGVSPTGQFEIRSPYVWNFTNLYTTGDVRLIAVPESSTIAILLVSVLALGACRRLTSLRTRQEWSKHELPIRLDGVRIPDRAGGRMSRRHIRWDNGQRIPGC